VWVANGGVFSHSVPKFRCYQNVPAEQGDDIGVRV
jgi:hypothetical protein